MKIRQLMQISLFVLVLFVLGCTSSQDNTQLSQPTITQPSGPVVKDDDVMQQDVVIGSSNTIEITDSGYNPSTLTIKAGETITFVNSGSRKNWPASAIHPTHRIYPGSDIKKCGTSEESSIFDACHGLTSGEEYSFTFNQPGTWKYHNHLSPGMTGTIIVG